MVSEQARRSIETLFGKAVRANLAVDRETDVIDVSVNYSASADRPGTCLHVLTIASYLFRLTTVFHLPQDPAVSAYFTRQGEAGSLTEVFGEMANMCCGAMSRELGHHFMHLGMSTPNVLDSACVPFFDELKANYIARQRISINHAIAIDATLFLKAYAPIDFRIDAGAPVEETGTIELF